jgi:hypothetical protein
MPFGYSRSLWRRLQRGHPPFYPDDGTRPRPRSEVRRDYRPTKREKRDERDFAIVQIETYETHLAIWQRAARVGICPRQYRRDLARLREAGCL